MTTPRRPAVSFERPAPSRPTPEPWRGRCTSLTRSPPPTVPEFLPAFALPPTRIRLRARAASKLSDLIGGGPYDMHNQAGATASTATSDLNHRRAAVHARRQPQHGPDAPGPERRPSSTATARRGSTGG